MSLSAWHEEPIVQGHDRKSFDCGDPSMNDFLRRYAAKAMIRCRENLSCH